jgi:hypothetical protein
LIFVKNGLGNILGDFAKNGLSYILGDFAKNGLSYILGDFAQNSSGHPVNLFLFLSLRQFQRRSLKKLR